jgi:hypothetical protein
MQAANAHRCPACLTASEQTIAVNWMQEMASLTKQLAPNQMAALGTEVGDMRVVVVMVQ